MFQAQNLDRDMLIYLYELQEDEKFQKLNLSIIVNAWREKYVAHIFNQ